MSQYEKLGGWDRRELANCASADAIPTHKGCRGIYCDSGSTIRVQVTPGDESIPYDVTLALTAGTVCTVKNVSKVYRYLVDSTAGTAQVYSTGNTLVNGVALVW